MCDRFLPMLSFNMGHLKMGAGRGYRGCGGGLNFYDFFGVTCFHGKRHEFILCEICILKCLPVVNVDVVQIVRGGREVPNLGHGGAVGRHDRSPRGGVGGSHDAR